MYIFYVIYIQSDPFNLHKYLRKFTCESNNKYMRQHESETNIFETNIPNSKGQNFPNHLPIHQDLRGTGFRDRMHLSQFWEFQ